MWVVFHKPDKKVVGLTAVGGLDLEKNAALAEVVAGLIERRDVSEYDAIQVADEATARRFMAAFPERLVVAGSATKPKLTVRDPEAFSLYVTLEGTTPHPVDGSPTIPADGASYATISLQKVDERLKAQRRAEDGELLYLRADHGVIYDVEGKEHIGSVKLVEGRASFRLVSEQLRRVASVEILSATSALAGASVRVEFV